jgi:multiple sugar transport system substrate-binding protein
VGNGILARSLACALLLAGPVGCAGTGGEPGSVRVWMYPVIADPAENSRFWAGVERRFERANPGVDVDVEMQPWANRDEKVATALAAGKGPDLVLLLPDQLPQYVAQRALAPLDTVVADQRRDYAANALSPMSVDGTLYGVPLYLTATTTVYNRALLRKAGLSTPPATWAAVRAAAPALRAAGVATMDYSASPGATENLNFYPLLWQAGGSVFSRDGRSVAFDSEAGERALTFLVDLYRRQAVPPRALVNPNATDGGPLGRQQVAFGYWLSYPEARTLAKLWGADQVLVGPPLRDRLQVTFGTTGGLALHRRAADPAAAIRFLRYLSSPEVLREFNARAGFAPPRTSVVVERDDPLYAGFAAAARYARPAESHPAARQVMRLLTPEIQAALTGAKSPRRALDDAARQANRVLAQDQAARTLS